MPWEQGEELPVGFTKKTIGFPRVANNCAVCHTATYRTKPDDPVFVPGGPALTTDVEAFFRYLVDCAKDSRFNADNLMREINLVADLYFHRQDAVPLSRHPDHEEAAARARGAVRVDLSQGFSPTGAAAVTTR